MRLLPRALWLLAALLMAGIAAELAWPEAAPPAPPPAAPPAAARAAGGAPEPVAAWAAAALERPLFNASRRPDSPGAAPAAAAAEHAEPPRLAGIMLTPQGRRAIFAEAEDKPATVMEGSRVGSWQVQAIAAGEVTLTGPDGARTVRPSFSTDPPAAPPAPVPTLPVAAGLQALGMAPLRQADPRPFAQQLRPSGAAILGNAPPALGGLAPPSRISQ